MLDRRWKRWKALWLGSRDICVHEPDVRTRARWFHHDNPRRANARIVSLDRLLGTFPFSCIAAVIDKRRFTAMYPGGRVDGFLPPSTSLMCLDFVMERFSHFLWHVGGDAQGTVVAESRGVREDAAVHHEYIRLHLDGTQFCHESQFRSFLKPAIRFERKRDNSSGLQVADLMARPIAEKVIDPRASPNRWDIVAPRFYDGGQGRPGSYGLKVLPSPADDFFGKTFDHKKTGPPKRPRPPTSPG